MDLPTFRMLIGELIPASIPGKVFWPYFAGIAIVAAGIFRGGREILRAQGTDKLAALGPLFFAVPMAVFASQHFTETKAVATLVPAWLPWHLFWVYFVGTSILAASLSIVTGKQSRLAALLLGVLLIVFEVLLHIPAILAHHKNVIAWAIAFRDLGFSGGALAFAGTQTDKGNAEGRRSLATIARVFLSVSAIFFGTEHLLHPGFMPGVDFDRSKPAWIPGHVFWSYLAGAVFLAAGMSLLANRKTRMAATLLGMTVLLLVLIVYLPIVALDPSDINDGLNFLVSTLAFSGAALLLARAMPSEERISPN